MEPGQRSFLPGELPGSINFTNVGLTDTILCPGAPHRFALIIQSPSNNLLTIADKGGVTATNGFNVQKNTAPLVLTYEQAGEIVRKPIHAVMSVAAENIGWMEIMHG